MFESALVDFLRADTDLAALLPTFNSVPAIFSDYAPETASMPFVVFRIMTAAAEDPSVSTFTVYFDLYDTGKSGANLRAIEDRIEIILDRKTLNHERYNSIRLFKFSSGHILEADPRDLHRNVQYIARAGRKKWAAESPN